MVTWAEEALEGVEVGGGAPDRPGRGGHDGADGVVTLEFTGRLQQVFQQRAADGVVLARRRHRQRGDTAVDADIDVSVHLSHLPAAPRPTFGRSFAFGARSSAGVPGDSEAERIEVPRAGRDTGGA